MRKVVIWLVLWGVSVLGAYGLGRWQGSQEVRSIRAGAAASDREAAARVTRASAAADATRTELARVMDQVQILQARRELHQSLMALDQRNFGTAQKYLAAAGRKLAAVRTPPAGTDAAILIRLSTELRAAQLKATEEVAQHRKRILVWVRELDQQLPAETAVQEPDDAAADSDAATPEAPGTDPATTR
jgi:hypothetical protein